MFDFVDDVRAVGGASDKYWYSIVGKSPYMQTTFSGTNFLIYMPVKRERQLNLKVAVA